MEDVKEQQDIAGFSTIKFFSLFEKEIKKINTYPLDSETLVIQQDAYRRLVTDTEDGEVYEPFATLENARKEKDLDMRFAIEFNAAGFLMHIEGTDTLLFDFAECFKDEQQAVQQILIALKMLASGQVATLLTERHGRYCASEFLCYEKGTPIVVSMEGKYSWWWKKNDESGYDTLLLRNSYNFEGQVLPKDFFFLDLDKKGLPRKRGRSLKNKEITPLTKKLYDKTLTAIGFEMAGKKPDELIDDLFYKSWEFYVSGLFVVSSCVGLWFLAPLPQLLKDHPVTFLLTIGPLTYILSTALLFYKVHLKDTRPDHPWVRLDQKLGGLIQGLKPSRKAKDPVDKLKRLERLSKRMQVVFCTACYFSFGAIIINAAVLYNGLRPEMLLHFNREFVSIVAAAMGVVSAAMAYLIQTRRFHSTISRIISILQFVGMLFWLTGVIKEQHPEVVDFVLVVNIAVLLLQMLISVIHDFIKRRYDEKMSYLVD